MPDVLIPPNESFTTHADVCQPVRYSVRKLAACYQYAKANPGGKLRLSFDLFMSSAQWLAWFRRCLDRKISAHDPRSMSGDDHQPAETVLRSRLGNRVVIERDQIRVIEQHYGRRVADALRHRVREAI